VDELVLYGRKAVEAGLAHSHFGNISKRLGGEILISATGSMLDALEGAIVRVPLDEAGSLEVIASTEVGVHRAIYRATDALAVLHTHSPHAVAVSLLVGDGFEPIDSESRLLLGRIPVVEGEVGGAEWAERAAAALVDHKALVIRGHGPLVRGNTVDEAFVYACCVEHAARVLWLVRTAGGVGSWREERHA